MGCIFSICKPSRIDAKPAETINKGNEQAKKSDGDDLCEGMLNVCGSESEKVTVTESGAGILMMREGKVLVNDDRQSRQVLSRINQFRQQQNKVDNSKQSQSQSSFLNMLFSKKRNIQSNDELKQQLRSDCKKFRANRRVSAALNDDTSNNQVKVPDIKLTSEEVDNRRSGTLNSTNHRNMQINRSTRDQPLNSGQLSTSNSMERQEQSSKLSIQNGQLEQEMENKIHLFTSMQQLCSNIISGILLSKFENKAAPEDGRVLCLFTFSCQGSNKGEISFELVEHSSILKLLTRDDLSLEDDFDCPLYHHIDVAALIVACIDERIREYNHLAAQSLKLKLEQNSDLTKTSGGGNGVAVSAQLAEPLHSNEDDDRQSQSNEDQTVATETDKDQSLSSDLSPTNSMVDLKQQHLNHVTDDFGLITLSTKQRSILQLKLMKYFNSITSKWVFDLIQNEVERLESKLDEKFNRLRMKNRTSDNQVSINENVAPTLFKIPDRVYLINLVPNQLSLFKSCLYLHQDIHLKDYFKYPYYAMKFERRTNIKLLTKEHAANKVNSSNNKQHQASSSSLKLPHISIANIRLPMLNMRQVTACDSLDVGNWTNKNQATQSVQFYNCQANNSSNSISDNSKANLAAMATGALADGVNEKLGPKFNDSFVSQFESINKLIQVRYNQTRDYNYMINEVDNYVESSCSRKFRSNNYDNASAAAASVDFGQQFRCWSAQPMMNGHENDNNNSNDLSHIVIGQTNRQMSSSLQNLQDNSFNTFLHSIPQASHRLSMSSGQDMINHPSQLLSLKDKRLSSHVTSDSSIPSNSNDEKQPEHYIGVQQFQMRATIPCAVELELFDSSSSSSPSNDDHQHGKGTKWHHLKSSPEVNEQPSSGQKNQHSINKSDKHQSALVPLAIFYEPKRSSSRSSSIIFIKSQQQKQQQQQQLQLDTSPALNTSPSHSPLPSSPHDCYQLVPIRVAYANNQSQLMLEAKRVYNRQLKLKSTSDLARLVKYINKVKIQLKLDCENWLMNAIITKSKQIESQQHLATGATASSPTSSGQHSPSFPYPSIVLPTTTTGTGVLHRKPRHLVAGATHHLHLYDNLAEMYRDSNQMPALIVYTIRLDISRIKSGNFQYPSNFHPNIEDFLATETIVDDEQRATTETTTTKFAHQSNRSHLIPILKLNDNNTIGKTEAGEEPIECGRPHSARSLNNGHHPIGAASNSYGVENELKVRPASSRAGSDRQIYRSRRHVQFRLSQAPESVTPRWHGNSGGNSTILVAQHRKWIDSQLFASLTANDDEYLRNLRLVTLVGDLVRFYVSDGARSCANNED